MELELNLWLDCNLHELEAIITRKCVKGRAPTSPESRLSQEGKWVIGSHRREQNRNNKGRTGHISVTLDTRVVFSKAPRDATLATRGEW
ncbi:hypothetical protein NPIL_469561 [Nephila pilipes]|uniref:Uncharacterized protein n=1 Tax=Nephila pilipes TaxID=299642 RepID=A0A8X6NFY7_NEPPI|nr:hypothetical protein NPIL_469561 [Nephila pilipes]